MRASVCTPAHQQLAPGDPAEDRRLGLEVPGKKVSGAQISVW